MALNANQKADLLFKKVMAGKTTSNIVKDYFEELVNSSRSVLTSNIWNQDAKIPNTNPLPASSNTDGAIYQDSGDNILELIKDLVLEPIPNGTGFYDPTNRLKNIIPYNFGNGSYMYAIKKSNNSSVALGEGNWYFDNDAGVLTFFSGYPTNVSASLKPKITCWKYVGTTGLGASSGFPGVVSTTYEDLIIDRDSDSLIPGAFYKFIHETKHNIPYTTEVNVGNPESLYALALSNNTLHYEVFSSDHPSDTIHFNFDDVLCEDGTTEREGKITYRKDNIKNLSTYYDFRNVLFRRWDLSAINNTQWLPGNNYTRGDVVYVIGNGFFSAREDHLSDSAGFINDYIINKWNIVLATSMLTISTLAWHPTSIELFRTINSDDDISENYKTFENPNCYNIEIGKMSESNYPYNNIVFLGSSDSFNNRFSDNCKNMTIIENFTDNIIESSCNSFIAANTINNNIFETNVNKLFASSTIIGNTIRTNSNGISLFNTVVSNIINNDCTLIELRSLSNYNSINIGGSFISIAGGMNNTIGTSGDQIFISHSFHNHLDNNVTSINLIDSYSNYIGIDCNNIILNDGFTITNTSIAANTVDLTINANLTNVKILLPTTTLTINNDYSNIVSDMVDEDGNAWYKTIDTYGNISIDKLS